MRASRFTNVLRAGMYSGQDCGKAKTLSESSPESLKDLWTCFTVVGLRKLIGST